MHNVEYHTVSKVYDWKLYGRWFFLEKMLLPRADRLISISDAMTQDISRYVSYPIERVRTIYHGVGERFRMIRDETKLNEIKAEYLLPENFILIVGHLYPRKNFANLVLALQILANDIPHDLVLVKLGVLMGLYGAVLIASRELVSQDIGALAVWRTRTS
jgi:glycosyltransferase involved in cell wall biosynthesis